MVEANKEITLTRLELAKWLTTLKLAREERKESEAALDEVIKQMSKKLKETWPEGW